MPAIASETLLEQIRELNLTYLILAQKILNDNDGTEIIGASPHLGDELDGSAENGLKVGKKRAAVRETARLERENSRQNVKVINEIIGNGIAKGEAIARLGLDNETANIVSDLTPSQISRLANSPTLLMRFAVRDADIFRLALNRNTHPAPEIDMHGAIASLAAKNRELGKPQAPAVKT